MKQIEVVAAIIHDDRGRIFATQRGYGDYKDWWEFPGGKMEAGETPGEALKREIWEELETIAFTLNHIWLQDHLARVTAYPQQNEEDMQMPMAAEDFSAII